MNEFKYKDILNYQYPNLEIEKDFPDKVLRAAQFAPFAALTGHDEEIEETARTTDGKIELDEYAKDEINKSLNFIQEHTEEQLPISITYFLPDKKKEGGKYITKSGFVTKLSEFEKIVVLNDGTAIPITDIAELEISIPQQSAHHAQHTREL